MIRKLWIPAVHIRVAAAAFFLLGFALGVALLFFLSWNDSGRYLLGIGLLGTLAAASFSGWPFHYKYLGLGEPVMFVLSGPVIAMGACAIFYGDAALFPWFALVSLPLSFLAILRLHSGNVQKIPFDAMAGTRTIARLAGFPYAKAITAFLFVAPFLTAVLLVFFRAAPPASLLALLSAPLLIPAWAEINGAKGPLDPLVADLRVSAARLQLAFGILYCAGFFFLKG